MSYIIRFALLSCALTLSAVFAAETAPIAPPPAKAPAKLVDKTDSWFVGTVAWVDEPRGAFNVRGHIMPYASTYAQMERDIDTQAAGIADPAAKQAKIDEVRRAWQPRLDQARGARVAQMEMGFQLPARGPAEFMTEADAGGMVFLNPDRGLPLDAQPVDTAFAPQQPAFVSLHDLRLGDRVMVGFASNANERTSPEAYSVILATPLTYRYEKYEKDLDDKARDTGNKIERNLQKGGEKIKHFFTGHD